MSQLLRVTLARHRAAAVWCAGLTAAVGLAVGASLPEQWFSEAELAVYEPMLIHRLANPFAPAPRDREGLAELPEMLTSRERLVAFVKRTGLLDQWASSRPLALRLKDQALAAVRGPVPEKDALDALVALLEKRLHVTVVGNRVYVSVVWSTQQAAFGLASAAVAELTGQRESREVRALNSAASTLEEQLAGVRAELQTRATHLELELARAEVEHRRPAVEGDREQLARDLQRASTLMVRAEEKHLGAEVTRRANALRFITVRPPLLSKHPEGPGPFAWGWLVFLVSALSGLAGALALSVAGGRVMSGAQLTRAVNLPVLGALSFGWSGVREQPRRRALALLVGMAVATGLSLGVSRGSLLVAIAPLLVVAAAWQVWTRPLKWPYLALLLAAVTLDDPTDRPYVALWRSPLYAAGKLLFANVAWFTGFELLVMGLVGLMLVRRVTSSGKRPLDPVAGQAPRVLRLALVASGVTVVWLIVFGVARGGDFREALWQFRAALMMPLVCTLAMYALDVPRDLKWLAAVLVVGTVVKAALGAYFMYGVALPLNNHPPHTTGHNDTIIFVTATVASLVTVWERASWRRIFAASGVLAFAALAMMLNDRRIAYVDIGVSLAFVYFLSPWHAMKRFTTRVVIMLLPVLVLYVAVGWNARARVFEPVRKLRSIVAPVDDTEEGSSNVERDIENYNITKSWQQNMFLGQGYGHAFREFTPSNDFSQSRFGHIGHNSVLWLLWIGGVTGFSGVLLYLGVTVYLLGRTLRRASRVDERVALLVSLSIVLTYLMQAFGDMGLLSMQFDFFVGVAVAIAGRLATRHDVLATATQAS